MHQPPSFSPSNQPGGELPKVGQFMPSAQGFDEIRQQLEGPKPLRVIAGLGGLVLCLAAGIGLLNIFKLLLHPAQFVLEVYECLFGLIIAIIELKTFFSSGQSLREFCYKWFPFLTIIGGKGAFYLFAGSLGLGFGWHHFLIFFPAAFVSIMGVIYVLFHFGQCATLREKYDQTVTMQAATMAHYDPEGRKGGPPQSDYYQQAPQYNGPGPQYGGPDFHHGGPSPYGGAAPQFT